MNEQKVKCDQVIRIGKNIKAIRKEKNIKPKEIIKQAQLEGVELTRETLVKIERCTQHPKASQLMAIRNALETTYDELLKPNR